MTYQPMLAQPAKQAKPADLAGTHIFDLKLDGLRALVYWDGIQARILNRSGVDITISFPEMAVACQSLPYPCVLDGEVVAVSGSFQDVAQRGKISKPTDVVLWVKEKPCIYVAFDVLQATGDDLRALPYLTRRTRLEDLVRATAVHLSPTSEDPAFFDQVKEQGLEGVIAKRKSSAYRAGRWADWVKYKAVRSLTCVGIGYDKGEGSREHFGAMTLALISPTGEVVEVGRVGTGFTASEIATLKTSLDAGTPVLVEIECLNVSKDGRLRFPVYKGIRSDLSVLDATLDQLGQIPRM